MKKLHAHQGDRVRFVDVVIRQAHPGPGARAYRALDEMLRDARRYQEDEGISIDADGRVAYYVMWTHAPNLHRAIGALLGQSGRGMVNGGVDHTMHFLAEMTDGWKGIRRRLPLRYADLETAASGMGVGIWLG